VGILTGTVRTVYLVMGQPSSQILYRALCLISLLTRKPLLSPLPPRPLFSFSQLLAWPDIKPSHLVFGLQPLVQSQDVLRTCLFTFNYFVVWIYRYLSLCSQFISCSEIYLWFDQKIIYCNTALQIEIPGVSVIVYWLFLAVASFSTKQPAATLHESLQSHVLPKNFASGSLDLSQVRGKIEQVKRDGCLHRLTFTYVVVDFLFRVHWTYL